MKIFSMLSLAGFSIVGPIHEVDTEMVNGMLDSYRAVGNFIDGNMEQWKALCDSLDEVTVLRSPSLSPLGTT